MCPGKPVYLTDPLPGSRIKAFAEFEVLVIAFHTGNLAEGKAHATDLAICTRQAVSRPIATLALVEVFRRAHREGVRASDIVLYQRRGKAACGVGQMANDGVAVQEFRRLLLGHARRAEKEPSAWKFALLLLIAWIVATKFKNTNPPI